MRKTLLLLLAAALFPLAAAAQGVDVESNWEFDMIFPNDSTHLVHQDYGVQGLAVDNTGKVWVQSHYAREIEDVETNQAQIRVFDVEGNEVDFSPVWAVTIGDSTYTWGNAAGRGLATDHNGDILASFGANLFRINAETGEGMEILETELGPLTSVGVAEDGSILVPAVLNDRALPIYSADMVNLITNVTTERPGIARSAAFSADGTTAYIPILGESGGRILTYQSELGVLGTYTLQDPIAVGVHGETIAISPATDVLWVSSGNPSDGINVDAGEPTDTNWELGYWYGFDQETGDVVDWIYWENYAADTLGSGMVSPRGTAFSPDGQYAYIANFASSGAGVQRFRLASGVSSERDALPSA
ncbi:MAG: hypothetical protein ACOCSK_02270, partial [Rhodothermales bacterium]